MAIVDRSRVHGGAGEGPWPLTGVILSPGEAKRMKTLHKRGRDVVRGDVIRVIGEFERVVQIDEYVGTLRFLDGPEPARIARFPNGSGMTLFPNQWHEVIA